MLLGTFYLLVPHFQLHVYSLVIDITHNYYLGLINLVGSKFPNIQSVIKKSLGTLEPPSRP